MQAGQPSLSDPDMTQLLKKLTQESGIQEKRPSLDALRSCLSQIKLPLGWVSLRSFSESPELSVSGNRPTGSTCEAKTVQHVRIYAAISGFILGLPNPFRKPWSDSVLQACRSKSSFPIYTHTFTLQSQNNFMIHCCAFRQPWRVLRTRR